MTEKREGPGRPPLPPEVKRSWQVASTFNPAEEAKVRAWAARQGLTPGVAVRRLVLATVDEVPGDTD